MGLFITFEGGEGSGKTFQAKALYRKLLETGVQVLLTHEPGGTEAGEKISHLLKQSKEIEMSPLTELLLFNASRAQLIEEVLQPSLKAGEVVICDRYTDSAIAYQSFGRGLDIELVRSINNTATQGVMPNLTILLDMPPEEGFIRIKRREKDRFEQEDMAFHKRIRDGFLSLAADEPGRWLVVDATWSKERIRTLIWKKVNRILAEKEMIK
ncbi:dTMP kinase [Chloroflexota bacterium]